MTAIRNAALAALVAVAVAPTAAAPLEDWRTATEVWRAKQDVSLRSPDGWLTVVGLFFLKPGVNTVGSDTSSDVVLPPGSGPADAGLLLLDDGHVRYEAPPGVTASYNGQPVTAVVELRFPNAAEKRQADRVTIGRAVLHLHRSGDRLAIRLRDPQSELLTKFSGLRLFPLEEPWRVNATFVPYDTPRKVPVQNVLGDVTESESPGEVAFTVDGQSIRLVAFTSGKGLSFVFRDATAVSDTYRIRFLSADAPDAQGRVLLDFNRAYNPPCAYNPHTTCPLPVPQNRLKVAIPAGEKRYGQGDEGRGVSSIQPE
jgi:uncharacterized protein (DUF1684 family)